jgi:hypothetical protein
VEVVTPAIGAAFAAALEERRAACNALFAHQRRLTPGLTPDSLFTLLRDPVAPIVAAVAEHAPERVGDVTAALYEFSLTVVGKDLAARYAPVAHGWRTLLGGLPALLAEDPRGFAGSITNALYHLCSTPGTRPDEWIAQLATLGPRCADAAQALRVGQVLAWRAGLSHYRQGALNIAAELPTELACAALGVPENAGLSLEEIITRLRADPWLHPARVGETASPRLTVVARVGAFRGFGGFFVRPPRVARIEGRLLVTDGEGVWELIADVFGATFHRAAVDGSLPPEPHGPFYVDDSGVVTYGLEIAAFPQLAGVSSFASDETTLVVAGGMTHALHLVAMQSVVPIPPL